MTSWHGRDGLAQVIEETLAKRQPGCVVGVRGSGRTRLLDVVADRLDQPVRRASGRDPVAVAAQLGYEDGGITAYTRIPGDLVTEGAVVLVDDADEVSRGCAVLLAQLGRAGVPILASTPEVHQLPTPLSDEIARAGWALHRLAPLPDDAVLAIAADLLGDDLSAESSAYLLDRAGGVPGIAVELLASASSTLRHGPCGVEIGQPRITTRLADMYSPAIRGLDPADHEWLVRLALAEQLPTTMLPSAVLDHLIAAGLATRAGDRVGVAGRLLADVVRDELTGQAWQLICSGLGEDLAQLGPDWSALACLLRVRAGEALECGVGIDAAQRAVNVQRWAEASDLLAGISPESVTEDDEPTVCLLRGATLSGGGEYEAAARQLHAAAHHALATPDVLIRIGAELGLLHAVRRSDPATAIATVAAVAGRLEGAHRAALDAELVKWHLMAGRPPPPLPGAENAADLAGRLGVAVISSMIASLDESPDVALRHAAEGRVLVDQVDAPGHSLALLDLSHYLALVFDVQLDVAEEWALVRRDRAARNADPALGMWEFAAAEFGLHTGRLGWAEGMASRADRHLTWQDFTGLRPPARALRAALDARRGALDTALRIVADLPEAAEADVKVDLHVARVHAERHKLAGEPDRAAALLVAAGQRATAESHRHLGVLALDEAWMLRPEVALVDLVGAHDDVSPVAAVLLRRMRSWHGGDAAALELAARDLGAAGFLSRAAHAWSRVAELYLEQGEPDAAVQARRRGAVLVAESGCTSWPGDGDPAALTRRELEIARLLAQRVRSREIAVRLGLSVRTVDNHVGRILRKLGLARRSMVEHVFAEADGRG